MQRLNYTEHPTGATSTRAMRSLTLPNVFRFGSQHKTPCNVTDAMGLGDADTLFWFWKAAYQIVASWMADSEILTNSDSQPMKTIGTAL